LSTSRYSSPRAAVSAQYALVIASAGPTVNVLPVVLYGPAALLQSTRSATRVPPSRNSSVKRSGSLTLTTVESDRVSDWSFQLPATIAAGVAADGVDMVDGPATDSAHAAIDSAAAIADRLQAKRTHFFTTNILPLLPVR